MKVEDPNRGGEKEQGQVALWADDPVQLSTLSSVLRALQTESPERAARLNHLSVAVGTGSYGIDPHLVVGGVIRESLSAGFR